MKDSGKLMSSVVVNVHMCGQEGEKKGAMGVEQGGTKIEAVDSEHAAARAEVRSSLQTAPFQLRGCLL